MGGNEAGVSIHRLSSTEGVQDLFYIRKDAKRLDAPFRIFAYSL